MTTYQCVGIENVNGFSKHMSFCRLCLPQ